MSFRLKVGRSCGGGGVEGIGVRIPRGELSNTGLRAGGRLSDIREPSVRSIPGLRNPPVAPHYSLGRARKVSSFLFVISFAPFLLSSEASERKI